MLLTVLALLSHLALLISATPGHVPEKRESGYSHYPRSKTVSPRSISVNSPYSHTVHARRSLRNEADDGGPYSGPAQIVQTATTLINVHPTAGYRKFSRNHGGGTGAGGNEYRLSEKQQSVHNQPTPSHSGAQSWTSKSTSTTTELNMYQDGKKVLGFKMDAPGGHMNYPYSHPAYQSFNSHGSLDEHTPSIPPPPQYSGYDGYSEQQESHYYSQQRPLPHSVPSPPLSTTTELNMYQGDKKVVDMKVNLPGGHMNYPYPHPPYHPANSYDLSPRYNTPPPESYYRPPPLIIEAGNVAGQRSHYDGPAPPPPPTIQTPHYIVVGNIDNDKRDKHNEDDRRASTTKIKIGELEDKQHDDDKGEHEPDGKKKYKVLICKLQQQ